MRRGPASAVVLVLLAVGVLVPGGAAQAQERSGRVSVVIPDRIVLNGFSIPVQVSSTALAASADRVVVALSADSATASVSTVRPNTIERIATTDLSPSDDVVLRVRAVTTACDLLDADPCIVDATGYYELVHGLAVRPSNTAVAKYGAKVALSASRSARVVTWTATATHWDGAEWIPWSGATLLLGDEAQRSDDSGVATWSEGTTAAVTASVAAVETDTVWSATSATVGVTAYAAPHGTPHRPSATPVRVPAP